MRALLIVAALALGSAIDGQAAPKTPNEATLREPDFLNKPPEFRDAVTSFVKGKVPKIFGGVPAPVGRFPWQVSLGASWVPDAFQAHYCGGVVIAPEWILTAAHCVKNLHRDDIIVRSGSNKLDANARRSSLKAIYIHPAYKVTSRGDDIALLRLKTPLRLGNTTKRVALSTSQADEAAALLDEDNLQAKHSKTYLDVTGWGSTGKANKVRQLHYVSVPYVDPTECHYASLNEEKMICAGFARDRKDSCQGDSGGGLSMERNGDQPVLLGIVSFGEGCALPGKPGVYTRVSRYVDWINQVRSGK